MASDLCSISHATMGRTTPGLTDAETGMPLEQSVPVLSGREDRGGISCMMYNRDGVLSDQATRCHRAPVPALAGHYWPRVLEDLLKEGFLQAGICPHVPREQLKGKPSMPAPSGYKACDGSGKWSPPWRTDAEYPGCEHLAKAVTARHKRAVANAKSRRSGASLAGMSQLAEQIAKMSIIGANNNAARDKGADLPKVPA